MNIFLDTSVLLAACASEKGASREVIRLAKPEQWSLITTTYVLRELEKNLPRFPATAMQYWKEVYPQLNLSQDVLTVDRPAVFAPAKDRPVLFSALAWADILLTLDKRDFISLLGNSFYGLEIFTPGDFLVLHRKNSRIP